MKRKNAKVRMFRIIIMYLFIAGIITHIDLMFLLGTVICFVWTGLRVFIAGKKLLRTYLFDFGDCIEPFAIMICFCIAMSIF